MKQEENREMVKEKDKENRVKSRGGIQEGRRNADMASTENQVLKKEDFGFML